MPKIQEKSVFNFSRPISYNGLALGEEADFEALNCLPALNLIRSTKLHLSTEPAFLPNACYAFVVLLSS
jgi:hypothetical protein